MSRSRKFVAVIILAVTMVIAFGSLTSVQVAASSCVNALMAVVRGTDNGLAQNIYQVTSSGVLVPGCGGWTGWTSMNQQDFPPTPSAPTLCVPDQKSQLSYEYAALIWRGTDNRIYADTWQPAHVPFASTPSTDYWAYSAIAAPSGTTIDQPACVVHTGNIDFNAYVVVRGGDNALYFNEFDDSSYSWGNSWVPLGGKTQSAPTLTFGVYNGQARLDLFVRGTDNGIWHKAAAIMSDGSVQWAANWDEAPAGSPQTPSAIAATGEQGTNVCVDVVVQGTDNKIYLGGVCPTSTTSTSATSGNWKRWLALGGATLMAPSVLWNYCSTSVDAFVAGTNTQPYGYSDRNFPAYWTGAGGATAGPVSATWNGKYDAVLLRGTNNAIYFNQFNRGTWTGYTDLGGLTPSTPAISNILPRDSCST